MSQTADIPEQLIIERNALKKWKRTDVYNWVTEQTVVIISGAGKTCRVADRLAHDIQPDTGRVHVLKCRDNTLDTINALERQVLESSANIVIGVGGGKALDVAKVVGTRSNVPVVLVPTSVSNDAICSPVAVIRMNKKASLGVKMPQAVIIDLEVIASSPERLTIAGIGDLLSNKTAIFDWDLACRAQQDTMNTFARLMANHAVEAFMNTVGNRSFDKTTLVKVLAESLVMSGIAMSVAGSSRPCSGSEHLISHALDYYCGGKALHGEQVALGILVAEYLQDEHRSSGNVRQYYEQLGLPTHFGDLGYTREEMALAIRMAPAMRDRYTVLNEFSFNDRQIDQLLDDVFPSRTGKRVISFA
ncbi:iron-containing alcohol dehydrogenase family protein [Novibacillus thermophilus]|uniref:Glycerol-1-phosphate dehydrogenase n=1 Tax=Novibacillus thermophilus TaxID=1471761 RepID=A0A1U9KAW0_9BACL|nr:iron-containing alcohol dehydrogenase family protein [Novibacillus thermophilus]AQS57123.1 glycerol-1-phosphate dehydrogenase [Novibacillus thermophilus]